MYLVAAVESDEMHPLSTAISTVIFALARCRQGFESAQGDSSFNNVARTWSVYWMPEQG